MKYGTFFEEFKKENKSYWLFYVVFALRRYSIAICIHFISNPITQLSFSTAFTLSVIYKQIAAYILEVQPFTSRLTNFYMACNEILTISFFILLFLPNIHAINLSVYDASYNCIKIVIVALGMNIIYGLIKAILNVIQCFQNRKRKILAVAPEPTNTTFEINDTFTQKNI